MSLVGVSSSQKVYKCMCYFTFLSFLVFITSASTISIHSRSLSQSLTPKKPLEVEAATLLKPSIDILLEQPATDQAQTQMSSLTMISSRGSNFQNFCATINRLPNELKLFISTFEDILNAPLSMTKTKEGHIWRDWSLELNEWLA
jgi:hypothetical protein